MQKYSFIFFNKILYKQFVTKLLKLSKIINDLMANLKKMTKILFLFIYFLNIFI
jgi:hypothetical protein